MGKIKYFILVTLLTSLSLTGCGGGGNGNATPPSRYTDNLDGTVIDGKTGLTWEQEGADTDQMYQEAHQYCEDLILGTYTDWRIPSLHELSTIVDYSLANPAFDTSIFKKIQDSAFGFWTSTELAWDPSFYRWYVKEDSGAIYYYHVNAYGLTTKCVRGDPYNLSISLTDNNDGTVSDLISGLIWEKDPIGSFSWEDSVLYCDTLTTGGYNDWRLPTINELIGIIDYTIPLVTIDTNFFPNVYLGSTRFWSGTSTAANNELVWHVDFHYGSTNEWDTKTLKSYRVRCARSP